MTQYRIKRKGVAEWLTPEVTPTTDPAQAVTFDSASHGGEQHAYTSAIIFLLENLDDWSLWHVQPVRERAEVAA